MSITQPITRQEAEAFLRDQLGDANTDILLKMLQDLESQKLPTDQIQRALADAIANMTRDKFESVLHIVIRPSS